MGPEETLKVLRAQYHDFLNRLQAISGLLDLGRHEKIKEYLGRAAEEFAARGRVAKGGAAGTCLGALTLPGGGRGGWGKGFL
ncbi:Spo0B domain-containing protein [Thermodesulfitimonas sp.]